jgi:hypothetical protein
MKVLNPVETKGVVAEFEVKGLQPRPHSFTMVRGVKQPSLLQQTWEKAVRDAGRLVMGYRHPYAGSVFVSLVFTAKPQGDQADGSPWTTAVTLNDRSGKWSKEDKHVPDLDNIIKSTCDGLAGIVVGNDVSICKLVASKVFGSEPGVKVTVYSV